MRVKAEETLRNDVDARQGCVQGNERSENGVGENMNGIFRGRG